MAEHYHRFKIGDKTFDSSVGEGPQHTHTVTVSGSEIKSSPSDEGPRHTHTVVHEGTTHTSGGPLQSVKPADPPGDVAKAFNKIHGTKITKKILQEVRKRGEAEYEVSRRSGVSKAAWGTWRVAQFLKALSEGTETPDSDLLPARPFDPWASIEATESELEKMQAEALGGMTRAKARSMSSEDLSKAHIVLKRLYDRHFDGTTVIKAVGTSREDVILAAASVEEELERRGELGEPEGALFAEVSKAREQGIKKSVSCSVSMTSEGTIFELPGGSILAQNSRNGAVTKVWSPDGSRDLLPMREPLSVAYSVPTEEGTEIGKSWVEEGAKTDDFEEFFLSGDVKGTLRVTKDQAYFSSDLVPFVLTKNAVGWMPQEGDSALPSSLERDIPEGYRYWKASENADPEAIRDTLIKEGFVSQVGFVGNDYRRITTKTTLSDPYPVAPHHFADPDLSPVVPSFDGVDRIDVDTVQEAVEKAGQVDEYLLAVPADAGAVEALSTLGRPFMTKGDDTTIFVSSLPLKADSDVLWLDKQDGSRIAQTLIFSKDDWTREKAVAWAQSHDFKAGKVDETENSYRLRQREPGDFDASTFRTISLEGVSGVQMVVGVLKEETAEKKITFAKADDEKQLVYGVVLEPETVDAQDDIYSEEEIEEAAHAYLLEPNTGLQHKEMINDQAKVVESYIAPIDMEGIKKGSWVMVMKIYSDDLWKEIKDGVVTGYSIGGTAVRTEEKDA